MYAYVICPQHLQISRQSEASPVLVPVSTALLLLLLLLLLLFLSLLLSDVVGVDLVLRRWRFKNDFSEIMGFIRSFRTTYLKKVHKQKIGSLVH